MEQLSFNFYSFIVFLTILQGFLLACVLLFNKKFSKPSNSALAITLLALCFIGLGNISFQSGLMEIYPIIRYLPIYYNLAIPIGLYYNAIYILHPTYKFKQNDYWFISPLILFISLHVIWFLLYLIAPDFILQHREPYIQFLHFKNFLFIFFFLFLLIAVLKKIHQYHNRLFDNFSEIEGKDLYWMRNVYFYFIPLWLLTTIAIIVSLFNKDSQIYSFVWIGGLLIIYYLVYLVISKRDVFEISNFDKNEVPSIKPILSNKTEEHYQNLLQLVQQEKLYQDAQLSMDTLAEKTGLSNGYLSKIINQKEGKNFYDFINGYRIEEVKLNLTNPAYAHYSILGIGLEAGFKSKSTFNAVFKKMTGMTPSAFKKSLN